VPFSAPRITVPKETRTWVNNELRDIKDRYLIGFNPGATYGSAKCWMPERYAELAQALIEREKVWIILFGSPAEARLNASIFAQINHSNVLNYTGQTTITQMAGLLSRCKVLVTNDTGTMHVASAVRTPVVAIFGPTDHITTPPFPISSGQDVGEHTLIKKEVECSPCLKRICPIPEQKSDHHKCMKLISVEDVYKAVEKYL